MGAFVTGDVVVMPFPFSDLSSNKRRPTLVLADLPGDDLIVCQITSQILPDPFSVTLETDDFIDVNINLPSLIRITRIFMAESSLVLYRLGKLKKVKQQEVHRQIERLFRLDE